MEHLHFDEKKPFQWPGTMAQAGIPASQSRNKRWWSGSWITWHQWWWHAMIPKKLNDDKGRSNSSIDLSGVLHSFTIFYSFAWTEQQKQVETGKDVNSNVSFHRNFQWN